MKNRLKTLTPEFKKILKTSSRLAEDSGLKIYLVGGVVRDFLLERPVFDLDVAVEGDAILFVEELAKGLNQIPRQHRNFGTAALCYQGHKIDFATTRQETYSRPGALPKVRAASLKKDLARRDFTINAMAISLNRKNHGQIIDYYGGLDDLKKRLIRVLYPESFLDDPLRILRAIRFEQRFFFRLEKKTYILLNQAVGAQALEWVNPHRLRRELILFFSESNPYHCIKRLYLLERFNFIDRKLFLSKKDFNLFIRIRLAINFYRREIKQREIKPWVIYLAAVLIKLPKNKVGDWLDKFGFKRGERIIINSIKENLTKVKRLDKKIKPSRIYSELNGYSYEAILFFYAYFPGRNLRSNIKFFLRKLSGTKIKTTGKDLKKMGFESSSFMGGIFKKLLYLKLDKGLKTKKEELEEVNKIIARTKKSS